MSKRCAIDVYFIQEIEDDFGGYSEELVLEQRLYGVIVQNTMNVITNQQGSKLEAVTWLKVHKSIENPTEKILKVNGDKFRILNVVNNIGKRFFYQIEQLTGGV